ncbi:MAG: methionine adenosyltransferase [Candidatus Pacebacteria bacterium]|nr:methionine adenosyltransferase [Candidatus Paceibacterota bacterium]
MKINIISDFQNLADSQFEIVERKGRGHPDTLADRMAELFSRTYSQYTKSKYGAILRHQFDKLSLMGGKCDVCFGGGNFRSPVRLLINGRATPKIGYENIAFRDLLFTTAADFLEKELRNFDFLTDCRVMWESTSNPTRGMIDNKFRGTSAIHYRFRPRTLKDLPEVTKPISNDTAVGCAWAPFTPLEQLVLDLEQHLTSDQTWALYPWMGADCKVMASRIGANIELTVNIPQLSTLVGSSSEYWHNSEIILSLINNIVGKAPFSKVRVALNTGDKTDNEMVYLLYTGSCIESGDEGQVSRGNRLGGVISSRRPFSIEGLSGKNPSYHAGKIYSVVAWDIANAIWMQHKAPCEVYIASQIDRPMDDPWVIVINTASEIDAGCAEKITGDVLNNLSQVTAKLLNGEYPLV